MGIILESKVISKLMFKKNVNNKKCAPKLVFFNEKNNWERFRWICTSKIDFEIHILALFDTSPLHQFSKFNNFLWVCWFLGKNLSNFVSPAWQLDNPYYHSTQTFVFSSATKFYSFRWGKGLIIFGQNLVILAIFSNM